MICKQTGKKLNKFKGELDIDARFSNATRYFVFKNVSLFFNEGKLDIEKSFPSEVMDDFEIKEFFPEISVSIRSPFSNELGDEMTLTNAVGIKSEEFSRKAVGMAHILQGNERLVLDALIKHSKSKDVALLVHDCIVYYTPKNPSDLSRIVFESTGFNLEFSEEPY